METPSKEASSALEYANRVLGWPPDGLVAEIIFGEFASPRSTRFAPLAQEYSVGKQNRCIRVQDQPFCASEEVTMEVSASMGRKIGDLETTTGQ